MAKQRNLHVVMFPWLAFGHMIPFQEVSKFIARKGHRISFISTPRNVDRLPELPPDLTSSITFIKIPLPKISQLHDTTAESTADIKNEDMHNLKRAFDGMESDVTRFLEGSKPDWIIYDFAPYWLPPVAARLGISRAFFMIINAWFLAYTGPLDTLLNGSDYRTRKEDFTVPPKWVKFETKVAYRPFEAEWILGSAQDNTSGFTDFYRLGESILGSEAILIRHCYEFEPDWLKVVEELYQRPVIPLGLMPPSVCGDDCSDETWVSVKKWLDGQSRGSVVYVALGSEVALSQSQLSELALGLELSGVPFLWAMRKPSETSSVNLPDGFEKRVEGDRGLVWKGWVPQLKILSHISVGGFLTHCGWSSIVEGLMFGHPLIALPFLVDQGLNSRVVAQNQVGAEIPRNELDGSYTKDSVANTVRNVMVENEGEMLRDNAKKVGVMFKDRELHSVYVDKFIEFLEYHKNGECTQ